MNNIERRQILETIQRMNDDYNNINREYSLNMMDYNRNMNLMLNIISNTTNISTNRNNNINGREIPRNTANRQRDNIEWELLAYYLNQLNNPLRSEQIPHLSTEQLDTLTEIVEYDISMNEHRCPITYEDFTPGERVCRIIHCGHYFKINAIHRWFQLNTLCPVCRHNLIQTNVNTSNTSINDASNPQRFLSSILSGTIPFNDTSFNTISYTFDIPYNN